MKVVIRMSQVKFLNSKTQNDRRERLGEILPLDFPLSVRIYVNNSCNFKCVYCAPGMERLVKKKQYPYHGKRMSLESYKKYIDSIALAGQLKSLVLTSWGEPLLHSQIDEMVRYAKEKGVARRIDIVTNGSLLTHELSDRLIDAGLDRLRVSLQGLDEKQYLETCKTKINFDNFVEQLDYFSKKKSFTVLYIKIMDTMVPTEEDKKRFYAIFGKIADEISIENLISSSIFDSKKRNTSSLSMLGRTLKTSICSSIFYGCTVEVDGSVFPCCEVIRPICMGNLNDNNFGKIWNGLTYKKFLFDHICGKRCNYPVCASCNSFDKIITDNDCLDEYTEKLIPAFKKRLDQEGDSI